MTITQFASKKRNMFIEIIASLLLVFFVHTLISSYIQIQSLKNMLAFYTLSTTLVSWLILISELLIIALIFFTRTRLIGFAMAFIAVTIAGITMFRFPNYPHHFGGIFNKVSDKQQLIIHSALLLLILLGIGLILRNRKPNKVSETPVVFT